jgi:hypothetical protein
MRDTQTHRLAWIVGLLTLSTVGCMPEATMAFETVSSYPEAENLVESVHGRWQMNSVTTGQCPQGFGKPPFVGPTRWIGDGNTLTIISDQHLAPDLVLQASGSRTLSRAITVDIEGCRFTEDITLIVDELANRFASGFYSAIYVRDDSPACDAFATLYDVPTQCEITSEWQALRTSQAP